jgi:hypothetical protein
VTWRAQLDTGGTVPPVNTSAVAPAGALTLKLQVITWGIAAVGSAIRPAGRESVNETFVTRVGGDRMGGPNPLRFETSKRIRNESPTVACVRTTAP